MNYPYAFCHLPIKYVPNRFPATLSLEIDLEIHFGIVIEALYSDPVKKTH